MRFVVVLPRVVGGLVRGTVLVHAVPHDELPSDITTNPDGSLRYAVYIDAMNQNEAIASASHMAYRFTQMRGEPGVLLPFFADEDDWDDLMLIEEDQAVIVRMAESDEHDKAVKRLEQEHAAGYASIKDENHQRFHALQAKYGITVMEYLGVTWAIIIALLGFGMLLDEVPWLYWAIVGPMFALQCVLTLYALHIKAKYGLR